MAEPLTVNDVEGDHARLGEAKLVDLATVDVVLLRQDPPFDLAYIATTHFLERIHPRTLVVNDPRGVRDSPEKLFVMDFPELMPPTLIARDKAAIEAFRASHGEVVMKPLYGFGGASVFKVAVQDPNFGSLFDLFATTFREPWVIQKFLPGVARGDKRIILVDGEAKGVINRVPTGDDIRSNMVRGGAARETELTEKERLICSTIGPELRRRGLLFVGIDVIDGYLTEINVTSPTGIRAIKKAWRTRSRRGDLGRNRGQGRQSLTFLSKPGGPCDCRTEGGYTSDVRGPGSRGRTPLARRAAREGRRARQASR